mgnify:FL=1
MKNKLKILENLLKNHDWFHQYSDDFGVYESGQEEWYKINAIMKALENDGFGKEADELYEKYLPEPLKY